MKNGDRMSYDKQLGGTLCCCNPHDDMARSVVWLSLQSNLRHVGSSCLSIHLARIDGACTGSLIWIVQDRVADPILAFWDQR